MEAEYERGPWAFPNGQLPFKLVRERLHDFEAHCLWPLPVHVRRKPDAIIENTHCYPVIDARKSNVDLAFAVRIGISQRIGQQFIQD